MAKAPLKLDGLLKTTGNKITASLPKPAQPRKDVPLNFRVSGEFKMEFEALAEAKGWTLAELLRRSFAAIKAQESSGNK